jgi:predicted nuclease of predicted toxin-antitoxin system
MDVHVPRAITDGLLKRGIDVLTAQDDDAAEFDDESLLLRATELGRFLFTQDEDLLAMSCSRRAQTTRMSSVASFTCR